MCLDFQTVEALYRGAQAPQQIRQKFQTTSLECSIETGLVQKAHLVL